MASEERQIFNAKARERLRTPDDLEKYIRVTNPGIWIILAACVALLLGLLAWGVFGTVATTVTCQGTIIGSDAVAFLDGENVLKVHAGDSATMLGEKLKVVEVSETPLSRDEAKEVLGSDYLVSTLLDSDWGYLVHCTGDGKYEFGQGVPVPMSITVEHVAPISLIFG